jgi:hypothetical protein
MKNQAIHYLALDVHQATVVASMRNEQGVVVMRSTVRSSAPAKRQAVWPAPRQ